MLLIAYGTRPEWLKVKPIIEVLTKKKLQFRTVFTGQHKDLVTIKADHNIEMPKDVVGVNRLDNVLSTCIRNISSIINLSIIKYTHVMVQGDTSSALGIALAAYNNNVKVIHLEAGLRTYDRENPFPEEANRQLISKISTIHFCPTISNQNNLNNEWVIGDKYVVGNTALDNLIDYTHECEYENKILVTLHRRENHDTIDKWFMAIDKLAETYNDHKFILPLHPNPNVQKYKHILKFVEVTDSLNHGDLLDILVKCKFVITDSGGIQEEASFFRKKTIVCRKITERPEALGHTSILCDDPDELLKIVDEEFINSYDIMDNHDCPFGDGKSAKKIVKILQNEKIV